MCFGLDVANMGIGMLKTQCLHRWDTCALSISVTFGVDKSNRNTNASNIFSAQTSAFRSQTPELDWFENCAQWKEEIQHRLGISDSLTNITFPATPTIPVGLGVVVIWKRCSKEVQSLLCFVSCIYGLTTFMTFQNNPCDTFLFVWVKIKKELD